MRRVRDPRVPRPDTNRPPEVGRIRSKLSNVPGFYEGATLDMVRYRIAEPDVSDGTLEQALIDEGLELEDY